jgi:uncharacterized protein (DUF362 family)
VSCYLRHLKGILSETGIEITPENRKNVDRAIHQLMGVEYKQCPTVWKKLKEQVLSDTRNREDFISKLKQAL